MYIPKVNGKIFESYSKRFIKKKDGEIDNYINTNTGDHPKNRVVFKVDDIILHKNIQVIKHAIKQDQSSLEPHHATTHQSEFFKKNKIKDDENEEENRDQFFNRYQQRLLQANKKPTKK
jgi:mevalonate pyrophosphate decarboxylase